MLDNGVNKICPTHKLTLGKSGKCLLCMDLSMMKAVRTSVREATRPDPVPDIPVTKEEDEEMTRKYKFPDFTPAKETGAMKFDHDKPRMDLLDPYAIGRLADVLTFGAQKYAAHNWRRGISKSRLIAAALRHLFAYLRGEDQDPESGLPHVAHAMCCCMFLLGLEHRTDLDDRYVRETD